MPRSKEEIARDKEPLGDGPADSHDAMFGRPVLLNPWEMACVLWALGHVLPHVMNKKERSRYDRSLKARRRNIQGGDLWCRLAPSGTAPRVAALFDKLLAQYEEWPQENDQIIETGWSKLNEREGRY